MEDATYGLGKHRVYSCECGAEPCRPLQASDTEVAPFPKPCDHCGADLQTRPFQIVDAKRHLEDVLAER